MPARPRRWTRHHCHIISYALVSLALMVLGMIFSVFAIFVKESDLSKVWLAGPTTIAVGLVLCGKVIIDFRPTFGPSEDDLDEFEEEYNNFEEATVFNGELDDSGFTQKQLVNSIDAQYQKKKQEVSLFIPNASAMEKEILAKRHSDTIRTAETDVESDIWNPRTSLDEERLSQLSAINSAASSSQNEEKAENCLCIISNEQTTEDALCHSYAGKSSKAAKSKISRERKLSIHNESFVDSSPSPLYQGETFVLHEKQYLI